MENSRERVASAHADLGRVVVERLLVVTGSRKVLDDNAVVRVLDSRALDKAWTGSEKQASVSRLAFIIDEGD